MRPKKNRIQFIKTTVIGGIVFLVPVVFLIFILSHAIKIMMMVAEPMAAWIPVDSISGVARANIIAGLAILVVCFVAGLLARRAFVKTTMESLESKVLTKVPGYVIVKGMLSGLHDDEKYQLKPVLATFRSSQRIGIEIERLRDDRVVVFVPNAPNPWSGAVHLMAPDAVHRVDMDMPTYMENVERFGQGTDEILHPPTRPDPRFKMQDEGTHIRGPMKTRKNPVIDREMRGVVLRLS